MSINHGTFVLHTCYLPFFLENANCMKTRRFEAKAAKVLFEINNLQGKEMFICWIFIMIKTLRTSVWILPSKLKVLALAYVGMQQKIIDM